MCHNTSYKHLITYIPPPQQLPKLKNVSISAWHTCTCVCLFATVEIMSTYKNSYPFKVSISCEKPWIGLFFWTGLGVELSLEHTTNDPDGIQTHYPLTMSRKRYSHIDCVYFQVVRSFFRTNRGTCIEWLTRIRLHILSIASAYGHPTTVIRHGYELITDMVKSQSTQVC